MDNDLEYYELRAREERALEAAAETPEVASAHRLLAMEYEAQAKDMRLARERPSS